MEQTAQDLYEHLMEGIRTRRFTVETDERMPRKLEDCGSFEEALMEAQNMTGAIRIVHIEEGIIVIDWVSR